MHTLTWIVGSSLAMSAIACVGLVSVALNQEQLKKLLLPLVAFSAGSLLGGALLHLLPEAVAANGPGLGTFLPALGGFALFFLMEQFLSWSCWRMAFTISLAVLPSARRSSSARRSVSSRGSPLLADCFVLTFRGIAGVSRFSWVSLACNVTGTVDRTDGVTQVTALDVRARLKVPSGASADQARRLLTKAEETCLVINWLKVQPHLESVVEFGES